MKMKLALNGKRWNRYVRKVRGASLAGSGDTLMDLLYTIGRGLRAGGSRPDQHDLKVS